MKFSRRDALKLGGALAAAMAAGGTAEAAEATPKTDTADSPAPLPTPKGPRVVVVGGGWSGLSMAKYTKLFAPTAEVVLVEQRDVFISCPVSNMWLVDKVGLEFITHDYYQAAQHHGYSYFHAAATGVDKVNNTLYTTRGDIAYDYLVLAPGIDYDYSFWTDDPGVENRLRQEYPAAFRPGSEHMTLKRKIHSFQGGTFLLTVPGGNYRCLPAPYERACLIADYFKHNGIKGKVLLLDENNDITIKAHGFHTAFEELYKEYIVYEPNAVIEAIDLDKKQVKTEFDTFAFDDASFYPHVRGGRLLEVCGVAKDTVYNRFEGDIDPMTYEVRGHPNIYITGDARPTGFSKSGNTSLSEGQNVAKMLAAKINKQAPLKWMSPVTLCISAVSAFPEHGIFIHSEYAYNPKHKQFEFATPVTDEHWKGEEGLENARNIYGWAEACYIDMFGAAKS
ncbi:NAD(P)/FAD-dependent oxidoreductase [Sulfurimonas sp. HSL-3221]|uniref:NAD(P)/FAD-dependent oxidoreductase n=1 Tax=Sulfurimonadaceae TaxID=2771471 RepID=UPI001E3B4CE8|nr:FAD/NAD(P)-binding oxidoreductase [Sulfurimonas sp. HSL-3221]UFS62132.1 NAD(P)/FAD-dependent oxidoreductase [Sulfurimonas sp. HSL-3221]